MAERFPLRNPRWEKPRCLKGLASGLRPEFYAREGRKRR